MKHPVSITFTGADGQTRGSDICLIAECARDCGVRVEIALLWSASCGRERYPTGLKARELWNRVIGEGLDFAVHVCGERSRKLIEAAQAQSVPAWMNDMWNSGDKDGPTSSLRWWVQCVRDAAFCGRVQVNVGPNGGVLEPDVLAQIVDGLGQWVDLPLGKPVVIGQHRGGPWPATPHDHVAWLHDESGGRGVVIAEWPELPDYRVGLAGGLGPSYSAAEAARRLSARAGGWVDMESRIRADGRLSPSLCCQVIREVAEAIS